MLAIQAYYAPAQMYRTVLCFLLLSYLQDLLNTEPMYLDIELFSTERLYTKMTIRYAVHMLLRGKYFVIVACLALNPFSFINFCSLLFCDNFTTSFNFL